MRANAEPSSQRRCSIEALSHRVQRGQWRWIIRGGRGAEVYESRDHWSESLAGFELITIRPTPTSAQFELSIGTDAAQACSWRNFSEALKALGVRAGESVLLDLTALNVDALLYLVQALAQLGVAACDVVYIVPESYNDEPVLEVIGDIQQPKGYASFVTDDGPRHHVFLLGFDAQRAERYIHTYDWDLEHCHFVIGSPPSVADGDQRSWAALSLETRTFLDRNPGHLHPIDATDAEGMQVLLAEMVARDLKIDVMPLGPKPWSLALVSTFLRAQNFSSYREGAMRILYDYGVRKRGRTAGMHSAVLFPWSLDWHV